MSKFNRVGKIAVCDGCGWTKKIVFVTEFGGAFCEECMNKSKV